MLQHFDGGNCLWTCRFICVPALGVQPLLTHQAKGVMEHYPPKIVVEDHQLMEKALQVVFLAQFWNLLA